MNSKVNGCVHNNLLVRIESKNKYSVYEIMPLSRKFLNICGDPFFRAGV